MPRCVNSWGSVMIAGRRSVLASPPEERHPVAGRNGWKAVWTFRSSLFRPPSSDESRTVFDLGILSSTWWSSSSLLLSDLTHGRLSALQTFRRNQFPKNSNLHKHLRISFLIK